MTFDPGRRLCLLFEAGAARYAVEATSVVEVSPPDAEGDKLRGVFELKDLSLLLGGPPEVRPGLAVVLDVSPTLAVRVRRVVEVADVAPAPFFQLPPGLGTMLSGLVRGAVLHGGRLYLELVPDALVRPGWERASSPMKPLVVLEAAPERALVFESQGTRYGLPLSLVLQVIPGGESFSPLPSPAGPIAGLFAYHQALWPIYSVPGLMGQEARCEALFVLAELAGQQVGLCAEKVIGVKRGFVPEDAPGEFRTAESGTRTLFLDFQRMFS